MTMANKNSNARWEAHQEYRRFEDRLPKLLETVTPQAAVLAWLMLGNKMWVAEKEKDD